MDPKGYETKPWWPYVQNLQEQIDAGGSGGGGVYELVLVMDTSTGDTTCNATQADIIAATKAAGVDVRVESTSGEYLGSYHMIPCFVQMVSETVLHTADFYSLTFGERPGSELKVAFNVLRFIRANREAYFDSNFAIIFDANTSSISEMQEAQEIIVHLPNFI